MELMKNSQDEKDVMFISEHKKRISQLKKETGPSYDSDNSSFIRELERRINTWEAI